MKKAILLILLFSTCFSVISEAKKPKRIFRYTLELINKPSEKGKLISFNGTCSDYNQYFVTDFQVTNNTDERIYIEWQNARFGGNQIAFGTDTRLTLSQPKPDEVVYANSSSISRSITGQNFILSDMQYVYLPYSRIYKNVGEKAYLEIIIPIRYSDGKEDDFKLMITAWYEYKEQPKN